MIFFDWGLSRSRFQNIHVYIQCTKYLHVYPLLTSTCRKHMFVLLGIVHVHVCPYSCITVWFVNMYMYKFVLLGILLNMKYLYSFSTCLHVCFAEHQVPISLDYMYSTCMSILITVSIVTCVHVHVALVKITYMCCLFTCTRMSILLNIKYFIPC